MVTVSVPGKIHVMGEHAVVYGKPALIAAINRRLRVTILEKSNPVHKENITIRAQDDDSYIRHALEVCRQQLSLTTLPSMDIEVTSDLKPGYHLGSSAAIAVAVVGALSFFAKKIWNPMQINMIAYEVEKKQHGNPSGGDNTTVCMGGMVWFRRELEFLKSIWQIPGLSTSSLNGNFYLIDTGRPKESTGDMVSLVRKRYERFPVKMTGVFDENERQTKRIAQALKESDHGVFLDALSKGERTLEQMGVVSAYAQTVIGAIQHAGGGAKILGGGGKTKGVGYVLAYHRNTSALSQCLLPFRIHPEPIQLGDEGIRLERKT